MRTPGLHTLLGPRVEDRIDEYARAFARREPFRHVVIDDFLAPGHVADLLAAFPSFEQGNARNEAGELGGKSTVERMRPLGEAYAVLDDLIQSRAFLDLVGRITGIPDLLYDRFYFGGGTHENRSGQELDPHVDFNRHPIEPWHRRLNLIVYLNQEWNDAWGGSLELHSDPRASGDRVSLITPLYNRCVIFETTEWSWHGFSRVALPPERRDLTRKSIAVYFYTRDRPADELADTHSTIYVERALPEHLIAGATLAEADVEALRELLARRDRHIERLYRDIVATTAKLEAVQAALYTGKLGRLRYFAQCARAQLRGLTSR